MMNTDTLERIQATPKLRTKPLVETRFFRQFKSSLGNVVPPLVIISLLLLIWEILWQR